MNLTRLGDSRFSFWGEGEVVTVEHIVECSSHSTSEVRGTFVGDRGIVVEVVGPLMGSVEHALRQRRDFTRWELHRLCTGVLASAGVKEDLSKMSPRELLERVVRNEFMGDDALIAPTLHTYDGEKVEKCTQIDPELFALMADMAINDQVKSSDLKLWKDDLSKQVRKRLEQTRTQHRKERRTKALARKWVQQLKKRLGLSGKMKLSLKIRRAADVLDAKRANTDATSSAADGAKASSSEPSLLAPASLSVASGGLGVEGAPATAPAVGAPDAVPPPPPIGKWPAVRLPGGWLRFNEKRGRCDAHCAFHGPSCKLDRQLKTLPCGLLVACLSAQCDSKSSHDGLKVELPGAVGLAKRLRNRGWFTANAAVSGDILQAILDAEAAFVGVPVGSVVEPATIPLH